MQRAINEMGEQKFISKERKSTYKFLDLQRKSELLFI